MQSLSGTGRPRFTHPVRQIVLMLIVLALVGAGVWVAFPVVRLVFESNPLLNGFIALVFAIGVLSCFWQVVQLFQSVGWIEAFVAGRPGQGIAAAPRLLAPLAALMGAAGAKTRIASTATASILDSVATRIDEGRDITRYLSNLLIFLGLLGTFYGLATTVPALVQTIRSLSPQEGESGADVFTNLMRGLEAQLGGMGTAFSSSLLGLAGSLVVGLLDLLGSHGQNRFYRELEDWLSSITRLGLAEGGGAADAGELAAVLDRMADRLEGMGSAFEAAGAREDRLSGRIDQLAQAILRLGEGLVADKDAALGEAAILERLAQMQDRALAGQERLIAGQDRVIAALAAPETGAHVDAEARMRLRSIDVQLLRILEEISAGRLETTTDLRADLAALTQAVRQLSRGGLIGRGG